VQILQLTGMCVAPGEQRLQILLFLSFKAVDSAVRLDRKEVFVQGF
jgi:hypothetical protein